MYEQFFQLTMKPFELVPNPKMLFLSRTHKKALNYLEYGFRERAGFILLTGEVGSGKTTIIRNLIRTKDDQNPRAMIFNTMVTAEQLLAMINEEFGLDVAGRDKVGLLGQLNDFLVKEYALKHMPLVIIDEAQNLSAQALEEVRLLSNLETDNSKLLQIVLVGQPELKELIAQPDLRQLRQRIGISCHLGALSREETEEYILHRLEQAGNREAAIFPAGSFDLIHRHSSGIPRLINIFCDFILMTAFMEETRELTESLVEEVILDLNFVPCGGVKGAKPGAGNQEELTGLQMLRDTCVALQSQLQTHKSVIKKVIKVQQGQVKRMEHQLTTIPDKLEAVLRSVERINLALDTPPGQQDKPVCRPQIKIVEGLANPFKIVE